MIISTASKWKLLEKLYGIHAGQCARFGLACTRRCASCCTQNVTLTTLEGLMLWRHLDSGPDSDWRMHLTGAAVPDRYQPRMTLNELADRCARDLDVPEEAPGSRSGTCPFLSRAPDADLCAVYQVRPFGCRAMVSQSICRSGDAARMPEFILTLNTVLLQYIEGLDVPGLSGNLIDVLNFLDAPQNRLNYEQQRVTAPRDSLLKNRPVSILMAPPEHRAEMQPALAAIQAEIKSAFLHSGVDW